MTILSTTSPGNNRQVHHAEEEQTILNNLWNLLAKQGLQVSKQSTVHFYVTLKSCKSLLLVGHAHSGKRALVESAGLILTDDPVQHYQTMTGHARWASQSQNVTLFVEAQANLNMQKLRALLEEAIKPQNTNRLFIACMNQISPAELYNLFTTSEFPQYQIWDPISFPPNFRLIGTMDTIRFPWWTPELLSHTAVIHWQDRPFMSLYHSSRSDFRQAGAGELFLQTCIRQEQEAYSRLLYLLDNRQPFQWLTQVVSLLRDHGVNVPREAVNQVIFYLANSWTRDGPGLFAPSLEENLATASDRALGQYVLPWLATANYTGSALYGQLIPLLHDRFPFASAFLQTLMPVGM